MQSVLSTSADGKQVMDVRVTVRKHLCRDTFKIRVSTEGTEHFVQVLTAESEDVHRRTGEGKRQEVQERSRGARNVVHRMRL